MQKMLIADLTPHPQNNYFFDDIQGECWTEFLESVRTSGVIMPIVCTQDMIIISGHQRVRACKELEIEDVNCEIKFYDGDDAILKDMIETNLRQRGIGNANGVKLARCIQELERIYGISKGGARKSKRDFLALKSQEDIAVEFGVSQRQLQDYKKLLTLIPELQELIETGEISASIGYKVWAKLPEQEQRQLLEGLGAEYLQSLTHKQTKALVEEWKLREYALEKELHELQIKLCELQGQKDTIPSDRLLEYENKISQLTEQIYEMENKKPEIVIPADYEALVKFKKMAEPKLTKFEEQERKAEENRDKVRNASELYYMAQDKTVTANGKISALCHKIERETGSALSSIRGQCENLEWNLADMTISTINHTKRNIDKQFAELMLNLNQIEMEGTEYVEID